MGSILYLMIAAFGAMLLVFVFWKRSAIFSGGTRRSSSAPGPKPPQDMSMQKMISILLPPEQQQDAKRLLTDYSELDWKAFERKYFFLLDDTGYEEEDFCRDIRSSLLILWMLQRGLVFLWTEEGQAAEAKLFLEAQSGISLSEPKGNRMRQMRRWAEELEKTGWSLLLLRDPFEGDPVMALPTAQAVQLIEKTVSDLQIKNAADAALRGFTDFT